jgi:hypothetical protein
LKSLCRELARLVRDLLVLKVDGTRFTDPDVAPEADRERLRALIDRFSREDLLRSFDVLTRAEVEVRNAAEPRYVFEMSLLRWIHLRKLVPLADLIARLEGGESFAPLAPSGGRGASGPAASPQPARPAGSSSASVARKLASAAPPPASPAPRPAASAAPAPERPAPRPRADGPAQDPPPASPSTAGLKDAFLAGIEQQRPMLFGTMVAQAERIDVTGDRILFRYGPIKTMMADQVAQHRAWLEELATGLAGRRVTVAAEVAKGAPGAPAGREAAGPATQAPAGRDLKAEAMKDPVLQSLLDVIPSEVKDITELNKT